MVLVEILHQCGKKVKTKSQKVLGANSYVFRSYRGETDRWKVGGWAFCPPSPPPILNGIKNQKAKCEVGSSYKDCSQFLLINNYRLWH